jgi:hypothetical protein
MTLIEKLEVELKIAEEKEEIAKRENEATKAGDPYQIAIKFSDFTNAQGYTNGLLEAIDIVRRHDN